MRLARKLELWLGKVGICPASFNCKVQRVDALSLFKATLVSAPSNSAPVLAADCALRSSK